LASSTSWGRPPRAQTLSLRDQRLASRFESGT
jgi:hypothetical protein